MVSSVATDVERYLDAVPDDRREVLSAVRALCLAELPGFVESMAYGMPSYQRGVPNGAVEVAFASQKQYISVYVLRPDVMDGHAHRLVGLDRGKGCVRFRRAAQVDLDLVRSLLRATARGSGPVC